MEYLQDRVKKVQQEKGLPVKEITLHMDVKTRWNSIITMLDSILKVPVPVIFKRCFSKNQLFEKIFSKFFQN